MYFLVRVEIYCFLFRLYSIAHYTLLRKGALSEGKECRLTTGDACITKEKNRVLPLTFYSAEELTSSL